MNQILAHIVINTILLALIFGSIGIKPARAAASVLMVTKTADTDDGNCNSDCSLREAIANVPIDGQIIFAISLSRRVIYLKSKLTLNKNMEIDGSALAYPITISGDTDHNGTGNVQVFDIHNGDVTLNSLIITKGVADFGGGIFHLWGKLKIVNCTISENLAPTDINHFGFGGGIYSQAGTLTITNSIFSHNVAAEDGGAVYSADNMATITNSTFSDNSVVDGMGGAINNSASMLIIKTSTFSNNSANYVDKGGLGGGVYNGIDNTLIITNSTLVGNLANQNGGGIANWGILRVANSTFASNSAQSSFIGNGGGGIANSFPGAVMTVTNSTFSSNSAPMGGGIYNGSGQTLNYVNTIIANSPLGGDCFNTGAIGSNSNNLVEDATCSSAVSGDPSLGVLSIDGGSTQTFALLAGSIAIDAGDDAICQIAPVNNLDQRGLPRQVGVHCDIGSYEYGSVLQASITLNSIGAQDGWVLESAQNSNIGGALNSTDTSFNLGDNAAKKQYRGVLSFSTGASIPDGATITGVILKVKKQLIIGGGNPVSLFKGFMVDIKNGMFGTTALQVKDFDGEAGGSIGPVSPALVSNVYSINLMGGKDFINKLSSNSGLTQIRLRFKLDDNNDAIANYLSLYSGNAFAANRPKLVITYTVP